MPGGSSTSSSISSSHDGRTDVRPNPRLQDNNRRQELVLGRRFTHLHICWCWALLDGFGTESIRAAKGMQVRARARARLHARARVRSVRRVSVLVLVCVHARVLATRAQSFSPLAPRSCLRSPASAPELRSGLKARGARLGARGRGAASRAGVVVVRSVPHHGPIAVLLLVVAVLRMVTAKSVKRALESLVATDTLFPLAQGRRRSDATASAGDRAMG